MRVKRSIAAVTSTVAISVAIGVSLAPTAQASTGNGTCASTEICVFEDYGHDKSKGYYDLGSPDDENFHGKSWYNGTGNIGDDISSWIAGSGTSCAGFRFFVDVNFRGASLDIAKGTKGNLDSPFTEPYNNIFSSYSKHGC